VPQRKKYKAKADAGDVKATAWLKERFLHKRCWPAWDEVKRRAVTGGVHGISKMSMSAVYTAGAGAGVSPASPQQPGIAPAATCDEDDDEDDMPLIQRTPSSKRTITEAYDDEDDMPLIRRTPLSKHGTVANSGEDDEEYLPVKSEERKDSDAESVIEVAGPANVAKRTRVDEGIQAKPQKSDEGAGDYEAHQQPHPHDAQAFQAQSDLPTHGR
jgi:hypothetical protein